ncbi:MAG: hypothetical protein ACHQ8D_02225 [Candidatus Rokuibacteriota bacterium]|jgi:hypothetical protein
MPDAPPVFRRARAGDVPAIVNLLADDPLGRTRERDEDPLPSSYREAFAAIDRDPNQEPIVACRGTEVVGALFEWAIARQTAQKGPAARRRRSAAREAYSPYVERAAAGANEADGPFSAAC